MVCDSPQPPRSSLFPSAEGYTLLPAGGPKLLHRCPGFPGDPAWQETAVSTWLAGMATALLTQVGINLREGLEGFLGVSLP